MVEQCAWCKFNPSCSHEESCDFRTLKYEKEAILKRITEEMQWVNVNIKNMKWTIDKKVMSDVVDKIKGMEIMRGRLVEDFKMSDEEIRASCGLSKGDEDHMRVSLKINALRQKRTSR